LRLYDFYIPSTDRDYPMGHISIIGKTDANTLRAGAPRIAPGWTPEKVAEHTLSFRKTSALDEGR
jgi:hypothetical protein